MSEARLVLRDLFGPTQDLDQLAWQPFQPGIEIVRLYGDGHSGPTAALLRYTSGAQLPAHAHRGYEHIIVLRGSQRDEHASYPQGTCVIHAEATTHRVTSDDGCVVLAIWQEPVAFLQTQR